MKTIKNLVPILMIVANALAQNTPVAIKDLKIFAVVDQMKGLPVLSGGIGTGLYLYSTSHAYLQMPSGTFLIKGTADKATTLTFSYTGESKVSVPITAGMTAFDTVERINQEIKKDGYHLILDHSSAFAEVFRFETIKGIRPAVIRKQVELANFQKAIEFPGKVYAEFHACGWICRPASYTSEFAALGAELNNFIENGESSVTYEEITTLLKSFSAVGKGFILPAINAQPNYEYTRRDVKFYRQGARLRFKNWHFPGERVGIYIGTMRTGDPFDSSNCNPGHAVLTIDPDKKVLIYEKIYAQEIQSVVSDVEFDYSALP